MTEQIFGEFTLSTFQTGTFWTCFWRHNTEPEVQGIATHKKPKECLHAAKVAAAKAYQEMLKTPSAPKLTPEEKAARREQREAEREQKRLERLQYEETLAKAREEVGLPPKRTRASHGPKSTYQERAERKLEALRQKSIEDERRLEQSIEDEAYAQAARDAAVLDAETLEAAKAWQRKWNTH